MELKRMNGEVICNYKDGELIVAVEMNRADLRYANLRGAYLGGANLGDADLGDADLGDADLRGANLRGAYLGGANLGDADLRGADLRGADLRDADGIISIGPIGSQRRIIYATNHGDKVMVQAGCFWGDLDELAAKVTETHGESNHGKAYRAAIEFIKTYAKAYWKE